MKKLKTVCILLLCFITGVYKVSAKSNLPEEGFESLAATHEAPALSTDPSLSAQPESDDQATASLTKGSRKSNINDRPEKGRKILSVYSFATRGAAKRHKVSAPSLGIDSSASPWTQQRGSQRDDLTKGVKSRSSWPIDKGPSQQDIADNGEKDSSSNSKNKHSSQNQTARFQADSEPAARSGTDSMVHEAKNAEHFRVKSTEFRWNVARDFGPQIEDKRRIRVKRRRKEEPERTEKEQHSTDPQDRKESRSSIIVAAVCAGVLILLCMITGLARMCKNCKKRCFRQKNDQDEMKLSSMNDFSEYISEEEIMFEKSIIEQGREQTKNSAVIKQQMGRPPAYQLAATQGDVQETWTLTETPTSTPLMAVTADVEAVTARNKDCTIIEIPEMSSSDPSFTCSSLSDAFTVPEMCHQSSSLTSVSAMSLVSDVEIVIDSPASIGALVPSSTVCSLGEVVTPQSTLDPHTSSGLQTPQESSPTSHPTTPKESPSNDMFSSTSGELTRTVSMKTDNSVPSTQSCKVPVAPRDEVVITIEDDDDEEGICESVKSVTIDVGHNIASRTEDKMEEVVISVESVVTDNSKESAPKSLENVTTSGGDLVPGADGMSKFEANPVIDGPAEEMSSVWDGFDKASVSEVGDDIPGSSKVHDDGKIKMAEDELMNNKSSGITVNGQTEEQIISQSLANGDSVELGGQDVEEIPIVIGEEGIYPCFSGTQTQVVREHYDRGAAFDAALQLYLRSLEPAEDMENEMAYEMEERDARDLDKGCFEGIPWPREEEWGVRGTKGTKIKNPGRRNMVEPTTIEHRPTPPRDDHVHNEFPTLDHKKNSQADCLCKYCEKSQKKSRGPRFFKLPRKLVTLKSKSQAKVKPESEDCLAAADDAGSTSDASSVASAISTEGDPVNSATASPPPVVRWNDFNKHRPRLDYSKPGMH